MKRTHLLFLLTLLACGERAPTGVRAQPLLLDPPAVGATLLRCSPLAPDSVSQTVGAMGGVLSVGPHQLSVPPGALDAPITITAVAPADTVNRVRLDRKSVV